MSATRGRSHHPHSPAGIPAPVVLLGVPIHPIRLQQLLASVLDAVREGCHLTVLYVNVHCMNVAGRDSGYRSILRAADLVYCDGTGVRLGAAVLGLHLPERMTGADWIHDLCRACVREDVSLYFLGGAPGAAAAASLSLQRRYPGLRIAGAQPGYGLDASVISEINDAHPDILLVGMGTPRQEYWIADHREGVEVPVVWAVGALFDFVSGTIPRGPKWMTDNGLEWLCRLAAEPRKLWRRYLLGNPRFLWRVLRERVRGDADTPARGY